MKTLTITGHFGRDVETRYTPAGKLVGEVNVAVTTGYGDNKETEWIKATFWEKSAETVKRLTRKGTKILLVGTPKVEVWKSKNGEPNARIALTVREFEILAGFADQEEREPDENEPEFMQD